MGDWWQQRKYGLLLQTSVSAVPAWAPIGESSTWYKAQLGVDVANTLLHQSPLAETLHYHAERWPHIERFDDFVNLLTFDEFDADEWVRVATDAGMGYLVMTAKHYDGWCWWDAPDTKRTMLNVGPRRNVFAEVADAAVAADLRFGASYSLLDWGDPRHPNAEYVDRVVHSHLLDLVDRYPVDLIHGRGNWGAGGERWRSDELTEALRARRNDLILNNGFWASTPAVQSIDFLTPWFANDDWELARPLGASNGFNRTEPLERLLTAQGIVAVLTEVIARGGHLLISIGPDASGVLPDAHVARLAEAGAWVRRYQDLIARGRPWKKWGDERVRYLLDGDSVVAIDTNPGLSYNVALPALTPGEVTVTAVTDDNGLALDFVQGPGGVALSRVHPPVDALAAVYRVAIEPERASPIELFPAAAPTSVSLAGELEGATAGDVVQLGDGVYHGPARIPNGVTLRGLGPDRTRLTGGDDAAVVMADGARLEHCLVSGGRRIAWLPRTAVIVGGPRARILACHIEGHIHVESASQTKVSSCRMSGVVVADSEQVSIVRSVFQGMGWDCAVDVTGGSGHLIDSNQFTGALHGVRLTDTVGVTVRNNTIATRWWGVELIDCEATEVVANRMEDVMRAVSIAGGAENLVSGNAVFGGDSGCVLEEGAAATDVTGNHWERLRLGLLAWESGPFRCEDNTTVDLTDGTCVIGP